MAVAVGAAAQEPAPSLRTPVEGCPVCEIWLQHQEVVLRAKQEVGQLHDGVIYFYHSNDPAVIEPLIRFAYERRNLEAALDADPARREALGRACGHLPGNTARVRLEISTSARGIFALLRTSDPETFRILRAEAQRAVRSRLPVWF